MQLSRRVAEDPLHEAHVRVQKRERLYLLSPTATLLEHTLLTQGFTGTSKAAFPRRL